MYLFNRVYNKNQVTFVLQKYMIPMKNSHAEDGFFLLFRFLYHLFQMTMTHSSFSPPTSASWYTEDKNKGETMTDEGECSVLG